MIKSKKRMLIIVIIAVALIPLLFILNSINFDALFDRFFGDEEETRDIEFYEPNYDYNIFDDPDYSSLSKIIYFRVGSEIFSITEVNTGDVGQNLFIEYFNSIINGDEKKYNDLFTDDYIKKNGKKDRFTMQRVYDASVEAYPAERINDNVVRHLYRVSYYIMKNDGTLRRDIGSDENIPLTFEVLEYENGTVKINSITKTKYVIK